MTAIGDGHRRFNYGQAVADYLAATLAELIRTEYLALHRVTPSGQQQVCVTHVEQVRYTELTNNGGTGVRYDDR